MNLTRNLKSIWDYFNIAGCIENYLREVARDFDVKSYNPPKHINFAPVNVPDEWLLVGAIPRPTTRLGWFTYHFIHGLAMRYPLRSVIAFSLIHTKRKKRKLESRKDEQIG